MPAPPTSTAPTETTELSQRLPAVMTGLGRSLRRSYGPLGVSLGQYPVLVSLLAQPGPTISELASQERVRLPSMTAIVNQMEAERLVTKVADPADRRCVRIALTTAGRAAAEAARQARSDWFAARLEHLSRAEVAAIRRALPALEHLVASER